MYQTVAWGTYIKMVMAIVYVVGTHIVQYVSRGFTYTSTLLSEKLPS